MIHINLLPEDMRRPKRRGSGWFFVALALAALLALAGFAIRRHQTVTIPALEASLRDLRNERDSLEDGRREADALNARAAGLDEYARQVTGLYGRRVIWSKILHDIKAAVNEAAAGDAGVREGKGLWLTRVAGYGRLMTLDGRAAAPTREEARELAATLTRGIGEYDPPHGDAAQGGIASVPLRDLLEEGWPLLKKVEPLSDGGTAPGLETVEFTIELRLKQF